MLPRAAPRARSAALSACVGRGWVLHLAVSSLPPSLLGTNVPGTTGGMVRAPRASCSVGSGPPTYATCAGWPDRRAFALSGTFARAHARLPAHHPDAREHQPCVDGSDRLEAEALVHPGGGLFRRLEPGRKALDVATVQRSLEQVPGDTPTAIVRIRAQYREVPARTPTGLLRCGVTIGEHPSQCAPVAPQKATRPGDQRQHTRARCQDRGHDGRQGRRPRCQPRRVPHGHASDGAVERGHVHRRVASGRGQPTAGGRFGEARSGARVSKRFA